MVLVYVVTLPDWSRVAQHASLKWQLLGHASTPCNRERQDVLQEIVAGTVASQHFSCFVLFAIVVKYDVCFCNQSSCTGHTSFVCLAGVWQASTRVCCYTAALPIPSRLQQASLVCDCSTNVASVLPSLA